MPALIHAGPDLDLVACPSSRRPARLYLRTNAQSQLTSTLHREPLREPHIISGHAQKDNKKKEKKQAASPLT